MFAFAMSRVWTFAVALLFAGAVHSAGQRANPPETASEASVNRSELCAADASGTQLCLPAPARRIATLSPGATELVYAAGAGDHVVAVVSFSDYPPEAASVTSVGSLTGLDLEALLALKPDLIIAWKTGNPAAQIEKLARLGLPVFTIEPRDFESVASTIEALATLAGTEAAGQPVADRFRNDISALKTRYSSLQPVSVFYEVWNEPLMTVSDDHLIAKVISLCGGTNVFGDLNTLVPRIDIEAVLARNPQAILAGGMGEENSEWLEPWRAFGHLAAVEANNLFFVPPSLIQRPTPRIVDGANIICEQLQEVRGRLAGAQ